MIAADTHDAIDKFEEVLKVEEERMFSGTDDLPLDAEAGSYYRSRHMDSSWRTLSDNRKDSDDDIGATLMTHERYEAPRSAKGQAAYGGTYGYAAGSAHSFWLPLSRASVHA